MPKLSEEGKRYLKLGISGMSGGGKTISALRMAYGITGDWKKIGAIDAGESVSESCNKTIKSKKEPLLNCDIGSIWIEEINAPYHPFVYLNAMYSLIDIGCEVIIMDSISQVWSGSGGILENVETDFRNWKNVNKYLYHPFVNEIRKAEVHLFPLIRQKNKVEIVTNGGRTEIRKFGTDDEMRNGFESELTSYVRIVDNYCISEEGGRRTGKDRSSLFFERDPFIMTEKDGELVIPWSGKEITTLQERIKKGALRMFGYFQTMSELANFMNSMPNHKEFLKTELAKEIEETKKRFR